MDLTSSLTRGAGSPSRRALIAVSLFVALLGVGVLDTLTGSNLSFGAFYVLGVVAATVAAGVTTGFAAAVFSTVMWGIADVITNRAGVSLVIDIWNGVTRLAVHIAVVVLVAALLGALKAARDSEASSKAFLAAAAHQLRTPVAALSTSVEALLFEGPTPAQERLLANAAGEASRLGHLVSSLLRTARLDQGEQLRPQPVELRLLCEEELDRARRLSVLEWRLTPHPGTPDVVMLDPAALRESLSNLFDNAMRHAASLVEITVRQEGGRLLIEVKDDGPGLPTGAESQAFDRFVTLDGRGGSGLGLSIARELTRQQSGDLTYAGKAFVIDLPLVIFRNLQVPNDSHPLSDKSV
jgi:signal transduction histidine kinase